MKPKARDRRRSDLSSPAPAGPHQISSSSSHHSKIISGSFSYFLLYFPRFYGENESFLPRDDLSAAEIIGRAILKSVKDQKIANKIETTREGQKREILRNLFDDTWGIYLGKLESDDGSAFASTYLNPELQADVILSSESKR